MKKFLSGAVMMILFNSLALGQRPPAAAQSEPVAIIGATIHTGDGRVIVDGVVTFEGGKITYAGPKSGNSTWQQDKYKAIYADGKHVYPGMIAMGSTLGLTEIEAVRPTLDYQETGEYNPNARTLVAYNTDSRVIPTLRSNGILLAQIMPQGGIFPGQTSVVQLDAWNLEDAAYAADEGVVLNWPQPYNQSGWWAEPGASNLNNEYSKQVLAITRFTDDAMAYYQSTPSEKNLRFESLKGVFDGSKRLYIAVHHAAAILDALNWVKKYNIIPVIWGGRDSWQVTDALIASGASVVLKDVHKLPATQEEDIDLPFKTPAILKAAGIPFAIAVNGFWQQRNLPFHAGQSVAFGLTKADALAAITSAPAKIMGIADRTGTIRQGMDANLIIATGDILDMRTCKVTHAFIQGRDVDLDNHHKQLYKKYSDKFENQKQ